MAAVSITVLRIRTARKYRRGDKTLALTRLDEDPVVDFVFNLILSAPTKSVSIPCLYMYLPILDGNIDLAIAFLGRR
jgi:hypothetical protein